MCPIYEYKCNLCGRVFSELLKANKKHVWCPYCRGLGVKIPSRNNFTLKGTGWSKDGFSGKK